MVKDTQTPKMMRDIADKIFLKSQENLIKMGKVDRGTLLRSGTIFEEGENVIINYDAPHAESVESGREPGPVPFNEIYSWVRRKLLIKNEKEAKSVAFLIQRKIKKKGIEPSWFMKKAINSIR